MKVIRTGTFESWSLEGQLPQDIVAGLGQAVFAKFAGCFVLADRITSLITFMQAAQQAPDQTNARQKREVAALFAFGCGSLRELANALPKLRGDLIREQIITKDLWPWELREIERYWEQNPRFIAIRNQISFHVNTDAIEKGLALAETLKTPFFEGHADKARDVWFALGHIALYNGFGFTDAEFLGVTDILLKHLGLSEVLKKLFLLCLERKGVVLESEVAT